jgi:hypoxanthine phosphoribosyltransferase
MEILFTEKQIQKGIEDIALPVTILQPDVLLCTLSGAVPFFSDLIKHLQFDFEVDFIKARSYNINGRQEDEVHVTGPFSDLEGKNVMIVEDMIDSGNTLRSILKHLQICKCRQVSIATLLVRDSFHNGLTFNNKPIFLCYCFNVKTDQWLVGYGLDDNGLKRNLKDIYVNI